MNEWIITSSLLILAAVLGRFFLKGRISLRLQYALWALVLVRLLVPVQFFTSDLSFSAAAEQVDLAQPVRQVYTAVRTPRVEEDYNRIYAQVRGEYLAQSVRPDDTQLRKETQQRLEQQIDLDVSGLLYGVWVVGMGIFALILAGCNVHFALGLRRSRKQVEEVYSLLPVYETGTVPTPCLFGLFQPAIYLTPEVSRDERVRAHVMAHELTHYRHGDHLWAVLRSLCLVLHWYNPLVWLAAKLSREDGELACDEGALTRLGEAQRAEYGRTLVRLTCAPGPGSALVAATTMTGGKRAISRRLKLLMRAPKTTLVVLMAVVLSAAVLVGCAFSAAPGTTEPVESTAPADTEVQSLITDGVIVYPGTMWNMTPEEVKAALNLAEADCFTYIEEDQAVNFGVLGFETHSVELFGQPVRVRFEFYGYTQERRLGLRGVTVIFAREETMNAVLEQLESQLGAPESKNSTDSILAWESQAELLDFVSQECYDQYISATNPAGRSPASRLYLYASPDDRSLLFISDLAQGLQLEGHIPDNDMSDHSEQLPIPDFTEPADPTALTQDQIDQVNEAFWPHISVPGNSGDLRANPICFFFTSEYVQPQDLDLGEFLRYFPSEDDVSQAEFDLLKSHYAWPFGDIAMEDMPVPIHEFRKEDVDAVLLQYAGITTDDLRSPDSGESTLIWLEETGCWYNFTSDAGFGMFSCTGGKICDGYVELYSNHATLVLREEDGQYYIQSHLSAD